MPRYYLGHEAIGRKEVTKEEFIKAERRAGFQPKCSSDNPKYWTTCATGGFSGGGISGWIEYEKTELAPRVPFEDCGDLELGLFP